MEQRNNPINKETLANKIKHIRTRIAQATQKEFADALGVTRIYINQLENPNSPKYPSAALLEQICDLYKIDYSYLTSESHIMHAPEKSILIDKRYLDVLFQTDEKAATPLQLLAQNYYRLLYQEMQNSFSSKSLNTVERYEAYLHIVYSLYKPLMETSMTVKEQLSTENIQDILGNYLETVKKQIQILTKKEEMQK